MACKIDENLYPHAPEVYEREVLDNGFSRGWGMHFHPVEDYWLDCHVHFRAEDKDVSKAVDNYLKGVSRYNVKKILAIPDIVSVDVKTSGAGLNDNGMYARYLNPHMSQGTLDDDIFRNENIYWMIYLDYKVPDAAFVEEAHDRGVSGVKLHNAPLISEGGDRKVWFSNEWDAVFRKIQECGMTVLIHVTQRLSASPYKGAGKNLYFSEGWKKGITYTNEDLLQDFLMLLKMYPGINFIGAHELFLGLERLDELLDAYPNLHIDSSGGFMLREDDDFYDYERKLYRDFFLKHSKRILFATDVIFTKDGPPENTEKYYAVRTRFIKKLRLPNEVLQDVAHGNAERLLRNA